VKCKKYNKKRKDKLMDVRIPTIGESITEVTLASWLKKDGDYVKEGDHLCEIESEKATIEMPAEKSGILKITAKEGQEYPIGAKIGEIAEGANQAPSASSSSTSTNASAPAANAPAGNTNAAAKAAPSSANNNTPSPAAKKILAEKGVTPQNVSGTGKDGRITKQDAMNTSSAAAGTTTLSLEAGKELVVDRSQSENEGHAVAGTRELKVEKMSRLRKTIAKRLVEAKNTTAMLTTFNEIDMHEVMALRAKYKDAFKDKYDIGLGFMSFFAKATAMALTEFPGVNAQIHEDTIIYHHYVDMGVAVSTPKGLLVPVLRNLESKSFAEIEREIRELAVKGRDGKITMAEMEGGTFTITNGGVFGSMLSTPIINIPQSAILGMHNIVERAHVVNGEIKIRPIMYVALSYDHRIVDGKESVGMLKRVKDLIEDPSRILLDV
jgi:2-oxoglutarate dehydrogenase E2 component (dihydrolipoamide succinyltransferase)